MDYCDKSAPMTDGQPNFLFISIDSLRPDYCSFYNEDEGTTPFLHQLASQPTASIFQKAISPSTWTLQVHGSIFTGLYPPEHGVLDKGITLGRHPTLASILQDAGYLTESYGRNGWLNSGDILRGFNHHHTRYSQHIRDEFSRCRKGVLQQDWETARSGAKWSTIAVFEKIRKQFFRQIAADSLTIDNVTSRLSTAESPFCFFVHLNGAHYVYRPRTPDHKRFGDHSTMDRIRNARYQRDMVDNRPLIYSGEYEFDENQNEVTADLYRGSIYQTDSMLERLITKLRTEDQFDDTVIVIFGDHGDHLGDDGHFGHQFSVNDVLIRVPLLIVDPTDSLPDRRSNEIVQLNDLYPTALSIADVDYPETRSIDITQTGRDAAYVYYSAPQSVIDRFESSHNVDVSAFPPAVQYALWQSPTDKVILYPNEGTFGGPAKASDSLRERLKNHESSLTPVDTEAGGDVSSAVRRNLEQMGYL